MKISLAVIPFFLSIGLAQASQAQSTTGGKSGGSTASTGTGYLTEGKRPSTSDPNSMTIDDEGASRAYMYVPPTATKNRSASPDGSGGSTGRAKPGQSAMKQTTPDSTGRMNPKKRTFN
jgi:hypothetical protein